jgi:hypothetical protein
LSNELINRLEHRNQQNNQAVDDNNNNNNGNIEKPKKKRFRKSLLALLKRKKKKEADGSTPGKTVEEFGHQNLQFVFDLCQKYLPFYREEDIDWSLLEWQLCWTEDGQKYWYNNSTGETTWIDPYANVEWDSNNNVLVFQDNSSYLQENYQQNEYYTNENSIQEQAYEQPSTENEWEECTNENGIYFYI